MSALGRATAVAHPNIALIKYWGNADPVLRLPSNGSISMTLSGLETRTTVDFLPDLESDHVIIGGQPANPEAAARASRVLDRVRELAGTPRAGDVKSVNSFPTASGIASSASGFAALACAAAAAAGLDLDPPELSRLARLGSGSACRSVYGGFVEWLPGTDDASSFSTQIAPPDHWDLRDVIAIVDRAAKQVSSSEGHRRASSSPLQPSRVREAPLRLAACRRAILERDFAALVQVVEQDSDLMHAVMGTSVPPIDYASPVTRALRLAVPTWRAQGLAVAYTQDAGPNLHLICPATDSQVVFDRLRSFPGILDILVAGPGEAPRLQEANDSG